MLIGSVRSTWFSMVLTYAAQRCSDLPFQPPVTEHFFTESVAGTQIKAGNRAFQQALGLLSLTWGRGCQVYQSPMDTTFIRRVILSSASPLDVANSPH